MVPHLVPGPVLHLARSLLDLSPTERDQLARQLLVMAPDARDPALGIDLAKRLLESLPKKGEKILRVRKGF